MKQVGSVLEANYKFKMDELMNIWTEMCKDNTVDIVVRLRALEVIEIRTFMWKPTQKLRDFYKVIIMIIIFSEYLSFVFLSRRELPSLRKSSLI